MAGVWKEALQRPVKMSQVFTTPAESLEIAILLVACRLTDSILAEASGMDSESVATKSTGEALICQNFTDPSKDDEMREEENTREEISLVCPVRVLTRQGTELLIFQI